MLDREVFSCIPFQLILLVLVLVFLRENVFPCLQKLFWNWSWSSAVKILLPRTISFVYRLYLFCNICQKYFLTVSSSTDLFKPIQLIFCFYRMFVTAYLLCTHRIVTFLLRWCPEACSETFLRKAKQCEVQRGTVMPSIERIYPGLLWCCCCRCHHNYNTVAKDFLALQPFFEVNALAYFRFWVVNAFAFLFFSWINRNILILWYFSEGVLYRLSLITAVRLRIHFQYYPHRKMLINIVPKRYGYKENDFINVSV